MEYLALVGLLGRCLLALLFVLAGISKLVDPKPVLAHMAKERVPGFLLYAVILLECAAGGALLIG